MRRMMHHTARSGGGEHVFGIFQTPAPMPGVISVIRAHCEGGAAWKPVQ